MTIKQSVLGFFVLALVTLLPPSVAFSAEFIVNSTNDAQDAIPGDGKCRTTRARCTLRAAVMEINALNEENNSIFLQAGTYALTEGDTDENLGLGGDLDIYTSVNIIGLSPEETIISGDNTFIIATVFPRSLLKSTNVVLSNVTITAGRNFSDVESSIDSTDAITSAILNYSNLRLDNVVITGAGNRYAVGTINGELLIESSKINQNNLAVFSRNAELVISNSEITNNESNIAIPGTGLLSQNSLVAIVASKIENNKNALSGAGIFLNSSFASIMESTISSNQTFSDTPGINTFGGAIYSQESELTIYDSTISNNQASMSGGGIYSISSTLSINLSNIENNSVTDLSGTGGGIYYLGQNDIFSKSSQLRITETGIRNNSAGSGGGLAIPYSVGTDNLVELLYSDVSGNTASEFGAGVYYVDDDKLTVLNSTISGNSANRDGGGLYIADYEKASIDISSTTIANNSAASGGNLFNTGNNVSLYASLIANATTGSNCDGTINSQGYNLDSDGTCNLDLSKNDEINIDPLLAVLAENNGNTKTHALNINSPAIDKVPFDECNNEQFDQRYFFRADNPDDENDGCDIGAYEFGASAAQMGEITFQKNSLDTFEYEGSIDVVLNRRNGDQGAVSVKLFASQTSSAINGVDYNFQSQDVSWDDGDTSPKTINLPLLNNTREDGDKKLILVIRAATGKLLTEPYSSLEILIKDDESRAGILEMGITETTIDEMATRNTFQLLVNRIEGNKGDISFVLDTNNPEWGDKVYEMPDGQNQGIIFLTTPADLIYTGTRVFTLTLTDPQGGVELSDSDQLKLTVRDDEIEPTNPGYIEFEVDVIEVGEGIGEFEVDVLRKEGVQGNLLLTFNVTHLETRADRDFLEDIASVRMINAGLEKITILIKIKDDEVNEGDETFEISLSTVLGRGNDKEDGKGEDLSDGIGENKTVRITIKDNDENSDITPDADYSLISFANREVSFNEEDQTGEIEITRTGYLDSEVSVIISVQNNSEDEDGSLVFPGGIQESYSASFAKNESSIVIPIGFKDNDVADKVEKRFILSLSNPLPVTDAKIEQNKNPSITINITDDEAVANKPDENIGDDSKGEEEIQGKASIDHFVLLILLLCMIPKRYFGRNTPINQRNRNSVCA